MSESPRPTRQQVDADLAWADDRADTTDIDRVQRLAAEVRALRAEQAQEVDVAARAINDLRHERDELRAALGSAREVLRQGKAAEFPGSQLHDRLVAALDGSASLAARTPQPAERDELARDAARTWAIEGWCLDVPLVLSDALDRLTAAHLSGAAPQPAVPDGEDVPSPAPKRFVGWSVVSADGESCYGTFPTRQRAEDAIASMLRRYDPGVRVEESYVLDGREVREAPTATAAAVPDGQDVPAPLSDLDARQVAAVPALLRLCDEADRAAGPGPLWHHGAPTRAAYLTTAEVRRAVAAAVPGEDVPDQWRGTFVDLVDALHAASPVTGALDIPARLSAAAHALDKVGPQWATCADYFRMAAEELSEEASPEVRAAVAAALARPPQGCTPKDGSR